MVEDGMIRRLNEKRGDTSILGDNIEESESS
jgi:hypothetical protein